MLQKRLFYMLVVISVVFTACEKEKAPLHKMSPKKSDITELKSMSAEDCGTLFETNLYAGKHILVGTVTAAQEGNNLVVTYYITENGWSMTESHLAVEAKFGDIPMTPTGNPRIGHFEFSETHDPAVTSYEYVIDNVMGLEMVYIAAHAVVQTIAGYTCEGLAEIEALIPADPVNVSFTFTKINSYYDVTLSNADAFDGVHLGWCADNNGKPVNYTTANLISSYSTYDFSQVIPNPENIDLLNYLMNKYVEERSFPVIQAAVWYIVNGYYNNPSGGILLTDVQMAELEVVVEEVMANGEGFVPKCGEKVVIFIDSGDRFKYQNTFILKEIPQYPYYKDETAWADGFPFPGANWATYFTYCFKW